MRLIDVDRVKDLLTELLMGVDGGTDASYLKTYEVIDRIEKIVNEWVDNQPTVEAIPVEWIEKWLDKTTGTRDGEDISQLPEQLKYAIAMINLMEMEWEKENEID